jgi:hypothetical protein
MSLRDQMDTTRFWIDLRQLEREVERLREALRVIRYWVPGDSKSPSEIARDALAQGERQ